MIPDDFKIPTPKEVREIWQRLTPDQRELIEEEIAEAIARFRRSQFKLVRGGRHKSKRDLR
jgi:mRNA-degrading endonuclease RelE of RelBE toxin-antitoxin system